MKTQKIKSIREIDVDNVDVYDITVDQQHHYILGNGIISHNSGGSGAAYSSSTVVFLTKAREKDGTVVTGNLLTCTVVKSRLTREQSVAKVLVDYNTGMNKYYGLLDLAAEHGIAKKVGNKYTFDINNPDAKLHFEKAIMRKPEEFFTQDILLKLDEVVKQMYCYGSQEEIEAEEDELDELIEEVGETDEV
jgi:hypothetical protein